jgi:hypothetical protein
MRARVLVRTTLAGSVSTLRTPTTAASMWTPSHCLGSPARALARVRSAWTSVIRPGAQRFQLAVEPAA